MMVTLKPLPVNFAVLVLGKDYSPLIYRVKHRFNQAFTTDYEKVKDITDAEAPSKLALSNRILPKID
jgi:hypothetical protein